MSLAIWPARRWFAGGLLLALFAGPTSQGAPIPVAASSESADAIDQKSKEVQDAVKAFNNKQYATALELLVDATKRRPELPPARVMLARLFLAANLLPGARESLEEAVSEVPDDPEPLLMLGDLAFSERRLTEASLLFERALELSGKMDNKSPRYSSLFGRAYAGRAAIAENRKKWDVARRNLEAWLKIDADSAIAHQRLGQVLFWLKKPDDAFAQLQQAAKLNEQMPAPEITMGRLYHQAGSDDKNQKQAKHWMTQAVEESPDNVGVQLGVTEWYIETGDYDEAKKHADAALKLKPEAVEPKVMAGIVARFRKDYETAEQQFEAAYVLAPGNFLVANQLALVLAEQNDTDKLARGLKLAEVNMRQSPNNADAAATLGWLYYKAGRGDEAARALQAAGSTGQMSPETAFYLAKLLADRGQDAEAKRWLRSALERPGSFIYRESAENLLADLEKKKPE